MKVKKYGGWSNDVWWYISPIMKTISPHELKLTLNQKCDQTNEVWEIN